MIVSAETDLGTATNGLTPGDLDLLTRFHSLNERSLLEEEKETKEKPTRGKEDETQMKGVRDAKFIAQGGRARAKQDNCNEAFIAGEIKNLGLGYSDFGSSCGSTRNEISEDSFAAIAVNDVSLAMQEVSMNKNDKGAAKSRGRGRRIQKE